jgi:hypothetical protein
MVDIIICEIGTINVRFYLLEIPYPHGYCRITRSLLIRQIIYSQNQLGFKKHYFIFYWI